MNGKGRWTICVWTLAYWAAVTSRSIAGGVAAASSVSSGLTITSFAVPVGVPVTTLNVPGVLFAYGSPQPVVQAARSPQGCCCAACSCGQPRAAAVRPSATAATEAVAESPVVESPGAVVLRQRCAECHSGDTAKGDVRLREANGSAAANWRDHVQAMFEAIVERRMPKGGELTAEEKVRLIEFLMSKGE